MSTSGEHAKRIGAVLGGRYRLERVLGSGGMGAVYEARDPNGQRYAVKMLLELTGKEDAQRFSREARIMSTLSHPNITRIVEAGVDGGSGSAYLVMELLSGQDVESLLERCGQFPPALAARVVTQACAGIAAAHAAGIIHRDIKPANLFLHHDARGPTVIKVCDFGIAKPLFAGETMTHSGDSFGSPSYMSPEQAKDAKRVDGRTDVWGLGMTLYHMLTGATAFDHAKTLHEMLVMLATRDCPPLQQLAPWVEPALAMVTHGALIRDVDQRCPTVEALANALWPLCGGSATLAPGMFVAVPEALRRAAPRAELPSSWKQVETIVPGTHRMYAVEDDDTLVGQSIGQYPILDVLGRGGMGAVYETKSRGGESLAIKVIRSDRGRPKADVVTRFLREARAVMSITSPHVVRVVDADTDPTQQQPFLVMERLAGQDLGALIRARGALDPAPVARIFAQSCRGLADAHRLGIIHRDIKPSNIFLHELPTGEVIAKICDFGVAKKILADGSDETENAELTRTGGMLGSPMYSSPEQARNAKTVDHRTDVWSLCISLYEALSGRRPWDGCSSVGEIIIAVATQDVPPLQDVAPWIPPELAAIVQRGLAREPADRFSNMGELEAALLPFAVARVMRDSITPVSLERRAMVTVRLPQASISSKTAYARTLTESHSTAGGRSRTAPPGSSSSSVKGLIVAGAVILLAGAGLAAWKVPAMIARSHAPAPARTEPAVSAPAAPPVTSAVVAPTASAPATSASATPIEPRPSASTSVSESAAQRKLPPRPPTIAKQRPLPPDTAGAASSTTAHPKQFGAATQGGD